MMKAADFASQLGIRFPIIQAPMGGGPTTPELVAAVSEAGGLGSLAAAYMSPQSILDAVGRIRQLTSRPFGINLFAGGNQTAARQAAGAFNLQPMLDVLGKIHEELGLEPPELPAVQTSGFADQLAAILEARPAVFSFTFGAPGSGDMGAEAIAQLRSKDVFVIGTATTVAESRVLAAAGVDAMVAQGKEAGGHRGTFDGPFQAAMQPVLSLVAQASAASRIPIVASGGIMTGSEIAQALNSGACAVQLGTAFLACPESGASAAYKKAILSAESDTTIITRAFSGRPARGIANQFTRLLEGREEIVLPYPRQNALTRAMRKAAALAGNTDYLSLWAGTGVARARELPAGELVATLAREMSLSLET